MRAFLACSVRGVSAEERADQEQYVSRLEGLGYSVHYPPRDTNQAATSLEITQQNTEAIRRADEFHVFYSPASQGLHFDMGVAFALGKPLVVARNVPFGEGKSYPRLLEEWADQR